MNNLHCKHLCCLLIINPGSHIALFNQISGERSLTSSLVCVSILACVFIWFVCLCKGQGTVCDIITRSLNLRDAGYRARLPGIESRPDFILAVKQSPELVSHVLNNSHYRTVGEIKLKQGLELS